jgi:hypothetical protein
VRVRLRDRFLCAPGPLEDLGPAPGGGYDWVECACRPGWQLPSSLRASGIDEAAAAPRLQAATSARRPVALSAAKVANAAGRRGLRPPNGGTPILKAAYHTKSALWGWPTFPAKGPIFPQSFGPIPAR